MKRDSEEEKNKLEKYFTSLNLEDWRLKSGYFKSGGQAVIAEVSRGSDIGVFRKLFDNPTQEDKNRFKRELKVLGNSEFKSPYIVEILAYSRKDSDYWYISRKGNSFHDYWYRQIEVNQEDPDKLVSASISIVRKLATGLLKLHKEGIVHRDIKMANLIMYDGNPQLIDFGIAYIDDEPRLTPADGITANKLSPLSQYYPNSGGEPWHDVFLLSQLLIVMLSVRPIKVWQGALDWRWVQYPRKMSKLNIDKIKAITAVCSNPCISPKDAEEFIDVLDSMFMNKKIEQGKLALDFNEIREMLEKGKALDMLEYSDLRQMYEDGYHIFIEEYKKLQNGVLEILSNVPEMGLVVNIRSATLEEIESGFQKARLAKSVNPSELYYCPRVEAQYFDEKNGGFWVIVEGRFFSFIQKGERAKKFGVNIVLRERDESEVFYGNGIRRSFSATLRSDSKFDLYDDAQGETVEAVVEIKDLILMVKGLLENKKVWKLAFKK